MTRSEPQASLVSCAFCTFLALFTLSNGSLQAETIHAPDFSRNRGGYRVAGEGITLAAGSGLESNLGKSLKITATEGDGQVKSPAFDIRPSAKTTRAVKGYDLAFWSVKYDLQHDREGNTGDRIKAEVICPRNVQFGSPQTVTLRATNISATTFHDVRLWPVGFVENLGLEFEEIRLADVRIATFPPGQQHEIKLTVKPRATRARAAGIYDIGLAVVNRERKHSMAMAEIRIADARTADSASSVSKE